MAILNNTGIRMGASGAGGGDGYQIEKSLRFNDNDSDHLTWTPSTTGNRQKWTWSGWVKRANLGTTQTLFGIIYDTYYVFSIRFDSDDKLNIYTLLSGSLVTDAVFRDPSAWYHIVLAMDTTQDEEEDRYKVYVNGSQITEFSTEVYPTEDEELSVGLTQEHAIGQSSSNTLYFDGYMAEVHFIDGEQLTASDFGETNEDTGQWVPIEYAGDTDSYGTNGFYLKFDGTDLGEDSSGKDNDWTATYLTADTSFGSLTGSDDNTPQKYGTGAFSGATAATANFHRPNGNGNNEYLTWTPSAPHTAGSTLKVYLDVAAKTGTRGLYVNGSDVDSHVTVTENTPVTNVDEWSVDLSAASITEVTSVATPQMSSGTTYLHGISIDGTYVADYGLDVDQSTDSPSQIANQTDTGAGGEITGNYCTFNPLDRSSSITLANGNLDASVSGVTWISLRGTIGVSSGKWFWETEINTSLSSSNTVIAGIGTAQQSLTSYMSNSEGAGYYAYDGNKYPSAGSYGDTYTGGDVIGIALDMDAGTLTFYKNGASQGQSHSGLTGTWFPCIAFYGTVSISANFGARSFAYSAPSGYKALNTFNLDDPLIADPSAHFDIAIDDGDDILTTALDLTDGADFVWIKDKDNNSIDHILFNRINDSDMDGDPHLISNDTDDEDDCGEYTAPTGDGVAWVWNAGTTNFFNDVSATSIGTIDSTYRANPTAGFSIVTYTGNGSANQTVAHGLNATPKMIHVKKRDDTYDWISTFDVDGVIKRGYLNLSNTFTTESVSYNSSTWELINSTGDNGSGDDFIAYVWSEVAEYSKFGSYTGNGDPDGPFVYCGFKPNYLLFKSASATSHWVIYDSKRNAYNEVDLQLLTNHGNAEASFSRPVDFLSNGFKIRFSAYLNISDDTYIFAAFAESPFKYSNAR